MKTKLILLLLSLIVLSACSTTNNISHSVNSNPLNQEGTALVTATELDSKFDLGKSFHFSQTFTGISAGGNVTLNFYTGNNKINLFENSIITSAKTSQMYIYENAIITNNGTNLSYFNLNRNYIDLGNVTLFHTPIVSNLGTRINDHITRGVKQEGGHTLEDNHFILKPNTHYLIQLINQDGASVDINFQIGWYE